MTTTYDFEGPRARISGFTAPRHLIMTGLWAPLRQRLERRRAVRDLAALDDRLLRDVGLSRGEIPEVVAQEPGARGSMRTVWRDTVALYRLARVRRRMIRDLDALPDWILNDIGVPRWNIEESVDRSLAHQIVEVRKAEERRSSGGRASLRDVVARLRASASPFPGGMARPTDA